jgi:hypothetical protein
VQVSDLELSRWELEGIACNDAFRSFRQASTLMVWTPLEELGAVMLNLFAPRGCVFWFVREYEAFRVGNVAYVDRIVGDERMRHILDGVLVETGVRRNSEFAYLLLGGLTRRYGDRYFPGESPAIGQSAGRHLSIVVPEARRAFVGRYFAQQHAVFGARAVMPCADGRAVGLSDDRDKTIFGLLQQPVDAMSERERKATVASIESLRASGDLLRLRDENLAYGFQAGAMMMLLKPDTRSEAVSELTTIMRFRADVGLRDFALPVLERMKGELDELGWNPLELADLREELRGRFDSVLSKYPVIQTDPFASVSAIR